MREDLEDLRSLVTSRSKNDHVHICMDAQTLGTSGSRARCRNSGTAATLSMKNKDFSSASPWNTCSLPQTHSEMRMRATPTFSLAIYHCRHDSQQIDFVLSPDVSLRSRTFNSSATVSDHWRLTVTIVSKRVKHTWKSQTNRMDVSWS